MDRFLSDSSGPRHLEQVLRPFRNPSSLQADQNFKAFSTISTSSSSNCDSGPDIFSQASSRSNASTASTTDHFQPRVPPWHATTPQDYGYELPCEFDCDISFHPEQFEAWISHSESHFGAFQPPRQAICTFCDDVWFENHDYPSSSWRERMIHIGGHYGSGFIYENSRPDHHVIEYMTKYNLLTRGEYEWAMQYSERKLCEGLVPKDFKTEEMIRKEMRSLEYPHDLEREKRELRRKRRPRGR